MEKNSVIELQQLQVTLTIMPQSNNMVKNTEQIIYFSFFFRLKSKKYTLIITHTLIIMMHHS